MTVELGTGYVSIVPDTKGLGRKLVSDMNGIGTTAGQSAGKSMGLGLGKAVLGAVAALGIGTLIGKEIGKGIKDGIAIGESINKVKVVFEDSADAVLAFGDQGAKALGMSRLAALEAAGTFGNLLTATGLGEKQAAEFSTTMVQLGADLASFNNTSPEEALEALRSGLSGETEPLKRFGINLQDAILKQEALNMGIYDGTGILTPAQKAQASYAVIMKQSAKAQGDFARTSDGVANKSKIVAAQWADLRATLGEKLMPVIGKILDFVSKLIDGFSGLKGSGAGDFFKGVGEAVAPVVESIKNLAATVLPLIKKWWDQNGSAVLMGIEGAFNIVAGAIKFVIDAITTVVRLLSGDFKGAAKSAGGMLEGLGTIAKGVFQVIAAKFAQFGNGFRNVINTVIIPAVNRIIDGLNKIPGVNIGKVGYITTKATDSGQTSQRPGAFDIGGIATGPTSGYPAILHGTEAILPLNNPRRAAEVAASAGLGGLVINVYAQDKSSIPFIKSAVKQVLREEVRSGRQLALGGA